MRNYLVIGEKWKRAIVFSNEHYADLYISKNCTGENLCTKYSAEEFTAAFEGLVQKAMPFGPNDYMAQKLLVLSDSELLLPSIGKNER